MTKTRENADYPNREFLDLESGNFDQTVASTGKTTFNGSAEFAAGKIALNSTGVISNYRADNSGYISTNFVIAQRPDNSGCIRVNNSDGTTTAQISGNGSASFAKYVDSGHTTGEGLMRIRQDSDTSAFAIYKTDSYDYKVRILGDGSATFAGSVKASRGVFRNNNNEHVIVGEATLGSANYSAIQLKTDGSADFAGGDVTISTDDGIFVKDRSGYSIKTGGNKYGGGIFSAVNNSSVPHIVINGGNLPSIAIDETNQDVLFCGAPGNGGNVNNPLATIKGDGSASFDGGILASDGNISLGFYNEGHISALTGQFGSGTAGQYSSMMDSTGITGFDQISRTPAVFPSGTQGATGRNLEVFGGLQINLEPDNDDNYTVTTEEYEEEEELTPYVPAVEEVVGPLGNVLVAGVPAVEATYQTVTKTREIRTYTGPTLDVKERLQNLISRIDAIEANEVVDDATDSSLLQLVASLTTRLDERDAQIAALTARVTTLEAS